MQMHVNGDVFWVESTFHEKDIPKQAGFLWHTGTGCIGNCAACKAGIVRKWWTKNPENAAQLIAYADDKARKELASFQNTVEQSRAEDVPDVDAFQALMVWSTSRSNGPASCSASTNNMC